MDRKKTGFELGLDKVVSVIRTFAELAILSAACQAAANISHHWAAATLAILVSIALGAYGALITIELFEGVHARLRMSKKVSYWLSVAIGLSFSLAVGSITNAAVKALVASL